jgi:hypothetical protein
MTVWMQTTGASLLAVNRCSPARVRTPAQDSRSAHALLHLAAVWDDPPRARTHQGIVDAYRPLRHWSTGQRVRCDLALVLPLRPPIQLSECQQ